MTWTQKRRAQRACSQKLKHCQSCAEQLHQNAGHRYETFLKSVAWLSQQGGPSYRVSAIFNWNAGSWDVQGVRWVPGCCMYQLWPLCNLLDAAVAGPRQLQGEWRM